MVREVIGHPTLEDRDVRKEFQRRYGNSKYIWIDRRADILDDIICFTEEGMRKGKSPILLDTKPYINTGLYIMRRINNIEKEVL